MDLRFDDVVEYTKLTDHRGMSAVAICKTCSTRHRCDRDSFPERSLFVSQDQMLYLAEMRAWNCCHQDDEPLDGYPEDPGAPAGAEWGNMA